jgi:threonine dehydrogenase-like Zn-dependent dehydrogenase
VEGLFVGVCGTDREIMVGHYGEAPPDCAYLILGHESLGRVIEAPAGSGFAAGDLVVGIVRRPDPVPCPNCAAGEWDMCRNGLYTECGIKGRHGYGSERYRLERDFAVRADERLGMAAVLAEPASVVAKAWEHVERIGRRAVWRPQRVIVTGAGPVGLLASLMGVQRGLEVHVLEKVTTGPKPELVRSLGAIYHTGEALHEVCDAPDIVLECTGVAQLVLDAMRHTAPGGIVCLAGLSSGARQVQLDATALNRGLVLENDVVFGSVNANRRHYEAGLAALTQADRDWLNGLITRRVPLDDWRQIETQQTEDVKTVVELSAEWNRGP